MDSKADDMYNECIIGIANKEEIALPNKYQCEIFYKKIKIKTLFMKHTTCYFKSMTFIYEVCTKLWKKKKRIWIAHTSEAYQQCLYLL